MQAGYLKPLNTPLNDAELDKVLQQFVAGITGIAGKYVRPRWMPKEPTFPEPTVDWAAFGILSITPDPGLPLQDFNGTGGASGNGQMTVIRHAQLQCLGSFYGPNAQLNATTLRDGAVLGQNRAILQQNGLDVRSMSEVVALPDLINTTWQRRYDLSIYFGIETKRNYAILSLLKQSGTIQTESGILSTFDTENY